MPVSSMPWLSPSISHDVASFDFEISIVNVAFGTRVVSTLGNTTVSWP